MAYYKITDSDIGQLTAISDMIICTMSLERQVIVANALRQIIQKIIERKSE